jgi:hypothetical protein
MRLTRIEPRKVRVTELPRKCYVNQAFYLGYGRNAWHSTWTNKYYPDCIALSPEELMDRAERQRVQGSVFKIEGVPLFVVGYADECFGIVPINDRSAHEYDQLKREIESEKPSHFWRALPGSWQNWLMVLNLDQPPNELYLPFLRRSRSLGTARQLAWERPSWLSRHGAPERPQFIAFTEWLLKRLRRRSTPKGPRPKRMSTV